MTKEDVRKARVAVDRLQPDREGDCSCDTCGVDYKHAETLRNFITQAEKELQI
ncbi:MAG: hypothetical protein KAR06_01395 [Deltaproteobacteria bacterium]|nr:hypothetical protein [Deltaproteobacteria bacterium]